MSMTHSDSTDPPPLPLLPPTGPSTTTTTTTGFSCSSRSSTLERERDANDEQIIFVDEDEDEDENENENETLSSRVERLERMGSTTWSLAAMHADHSYMCSSHVYDSLARVGPHVSVLDLSHNKLDEDCVFQLGRLMRRNCLCSLETLDLSFNELTDDGIVELVDMLMACPPSLRTVDVSFNPCGIDGAQNIVALLRTQSCPERVVYEGNEGSELVDNVQRPERAVKPKLESILSPPRGNFLPSHTTPQVSPRRSLHSGFLIPSPFGKVSFRVASLTPTHASRSPAASVISNTEGIHANEDAHEWVGHIQEDSSIFVDRAPDGEAVQRLFHSTEEFVSAIEDLQFDLEQRSSLVDSSDSNMTPSSLLHKLALDSDQSERSSSSDLDVDISQGEASRLDFDGVGMDNLVHSSESMSGRDVAFDQPQVLQEGEYTAFSMSQNDVEEISSVLQRLSDRFDSPS